MARRSAPAAATISLPPWVGLLIAIAVLYFARSVLIPFALAVLCAFILGPIVKRLEGWRVPRVPAVLLVLLIAAAVLGGIGYAVGEQFIGIVSALPQYQQNVRSRVASVREPSAITKILDSLQDFSKEITTAPPGQDAVKPREPAKSAQRAEPERPQDSAPVPVQLVEPPRSALQSLRDLASPLLSPLETFGLVIILTTFMLMDREDLRNRLLGLFGLRHLHVTTKAVDDATQRLSRYLMLQFLVNALVGAVIAAGLAVIGVHSALLWGVMAMLLRFIPYVGMTIAAAMPTLLTVATTTSGWWMPAEVVAVFLIVELITGNAVEPLLYGAHTGLSAMAILASVVFWAALWGPVGLILSTPLTVCLSVLGRYSPQLRFINTLLGADSGITIDAVFYQRLLALDQPDALAIVESYLKEKSLVELYDQVLIPALTMAERDRHGGQLEAKRESFVLQSIREFVTELTETGAALKGAHGAGEDRKELRENRVFCIPAHDISDEITAAMLGQLTEREGYPTLSFPFTKEPAGLLEGLLPQANDIVCVTSVPPLALTHARTVSQEIREAFPDVKLLVGLWHYPAESGHTIARLQQTTGGTVVTTLASALDQLRSIAVGTATTV